MRIEKCALFSNDFPITKDRDISAVLRAFVISRCGQTDIATHTHTPVDLI